MPGVVENDNSEKDLEEKQENTTDNSFDDKDLSPDSSMKGGSRNRYPNGYNSDQIIDSPDDSSRFLLEHLATFSVGSEYGLIYPKDGLRRLLQMEKTNGIWTQKMQMKLDKNWVFILDYENGDIVEKFPMDLISDPTAYTNNDPKELYNNILIFIVREDPKSKNTNPSEMHIFQCSRVYAQDIVDEMKMLMSGKSKAKSADNIRHLPPPPHNPPPDPPINGNSSKVSEHVAMFSASAMPPSSSYPPSSRGPPMLHQRVERTAYARESNDETSSTTSDKYEREVTILNHCFDDIERFVVRLQHSAAAYKELERRQKSRKHKKKDMGDGMLSIRAKPPPEREFVDVLQKFKLSFNLLAKLKSHIHDPNAPELVHFLFTPLALIIDAARDSNHTANLSANVVSPLLTRDAIELLVNCCTSKETDLWHSLGDAWIIPRDQWKGYESNYRPIFSNGWAPENPLDEGGLISHRMQRPEPDLRDQDYQRVFSHPERDSRYGSEYFGSERDDNDRNESPGVIPDHHPHLRPSYDRQYDHMPPESRRDLIDRGSAMSPESDFHDPRDRDLRSEFSSDSIEHSDLPLNPQRQFDRQQMQWLDELKSRRAKIVQVVYPRTANNEKELTVIRGEILEVLDDSRKWWKARNMRGQIAHVPHTIVTSYPSIEDDVFNNPVYGSRSSRENYYSPDGSPLKEQYIDEGTTRSQEAMRSSTAVASRPAPADWVRRERQGNIPPSRINLNSEINKNRSPSPLPSPPCTTNSPSSPQSLTTSPTEWPSPPTDNLIPLEDHKTNPVQKTNSSDKPRNQPVKHNRSSLYNDSPKETITVTFNQKTPTLESVKSRSTTDTSALHNSTADFTQEFQEELKASIAQKKGQKIWKKVTCPEHQITDCYYIDLTSTQGDLQHWLKLKGFNEKIQEMLKSMTVEMLFKSKKSQLEKYFGNEGAKLYSHLLIQKNMCGYKNSSDELSSILAQRKQRTETQ